MSSSRAAVVQPIDQSLASLVWPCDPAEFLRQYWSRAVFHSPASTDRLSHLVEIFGQHEVESLLGFAVPGEIHAWTSDGGEAFNSRQVDRKTAICLYQDGATLYFHIDLTPYIRKWRQTLRAELAVPAVQISAFCCREGGGTVLHFDANENFTIQLTGQKNWQLAENHTVDSPTRNWIPTTPVPIELRHQSSPALEFEIPKDTACIQMNAGDVLYVPRGWWHGTLARAESISLNIAIPPNTLADTVAERIRLLLTQQPEWRKNVIDHHAPESQRQSAIGELAEQLTDLGKLVSSLRAEEFIEPHDSTAPPAFDEETQLRKQNGSYWYFESQGCGSDDHQITLVSPHSRHLTLSGDNDLVTLLQTIDKSPDRINTHDLASLNPCFSIPELTRLITTLCKYGYLGVA